MEIFSIWMPWEQKQNLTWELKNLRAIAKGKGPIPLWQESRLGKFGATMDRAKCEEMKAEIRALRDRLHVHAPRRDHTVSTIDRAYGLDGSIRSVPSTSHEDASARIYGFKDARERAALEQHARWIAECEAEEAA